jgi:peptidoglycan/LPS O-acetylase OafA/YrhL
VPILPLVLVAVLYAAARLAEQRWGAVIVVVLISISGANAVLTIVLTPFFPPEFGAPLAQLVLPSLADGVAFANVLSSAFGMPPTAVVVLTFAIVAVTLIWAAERVAKVRAWWLSATCLVTVVLVLLTYSWQGHAPPAETEIIRSEVLRRLGHAGAANSIEASFSPAEVPVAD